MIRSPASAAALPITNSPAAKVPTGPTAVNTESSENTMSMSAICTTSAANLPRTASVNMSAVVLGWSARRVRNALAAGLLRAQGDVWQRVELASIEEVRGRPITQSEWMAADRQRDHARKVQRAYNQSRRDQPARQERAGSHAAA